MPDELTATPPPQATRGQLLRDCAVVLVLFAGGGLLAGLVWRWVWSPPRGVVVDGVWYVGPDAAFSGTALYVLVGTFAGLLVGVACGLVAARQPLLTLAVVVVGSGLAGWLMWWSGSLGGPPDPHQRAATTADRTELPGAREVSGWSPFVAFPAGALAGLCATFIAVAPDPVDAPRRGDHAG